MAAVTAALPPLLSSLSSLQPLMLSREGEAGCGNAQWRGVLEVAAGAREILGSGGGGGLCELAASVRVALLRLHRCVQRLVRFRAFGSGFTGVSLRDVVKVSYQTERTHTDMQFCSPDTRTHAPQALVGRAGARKLSERDTAHRGRGGGAW